MKYLLIFVVLCAGRAFGQNAYGTDYLTFHCTAPDPNAPPNFGDFPKPGLVPSGAASGNAILYCDNSAGALKLSFNGGAYTTFGGGLPAGLTFVAPTFTVSTAGSGSGVLALSGNTSGTATLTAPAVAGTSTNPIVISNVLQVPVGTATGGQLAYSFTGATSVGLWVGGGNTLHLQTTDLTIDPGTNRFVNITGTGSSLHFASSSSQHIQTFAAQSDISGTCTMSSGTCTAITFGNAYTSAPACTVSWTGSGTLTGILSTAATTTQIKPTSSVGTDTAVVTYICVGNPN